MQLTRNPDNAMVGGVCAGLGDYFKVDTTLIRAVFIAASVVGVFGPALYVVLWILLEDHRSDPEEPHRSSQVGGEASERNRESVSTLTTRPEPAASK